MTRHRNSGELGPGEEGPWPKPSKGWTPPPVGRHEEWRPVVPVVAAQDTAGATKPKKPVPVLVKLTFVNGRRMELPSFAHAWSKTHVLVAVDWPMSYYTTVKQVWLPASDVRRRPVEPQRRDWYGPGHG